MSFLTVSEVARRLSTPDQAVLPKAITSLFYNRVLRDDLCPVSSGRRMIPEDYICMIEMALRRAGKLPPTKSTSQFTEVHCAQA